MTHTNSRRLVLILAIAAASIGVRADEGMWTFDNPPLTTLRDRYKFTPPAGWLDHLRLSSVRFNDGGSGSFISPNGLVLTNHHVALGQLEKASTAQKNYVRDGFYASRRDDELKATDLELNVLTVDRDTCTGCEKCIAPCPVGALAMVANA